MRIVSLLPSATEILFALGFDREIVGVSHECDFPPQARTKRAVIRSRIPHDSSPAEIDRLVSEYVHRGESLYAVDADALEALAPDLIITQDLCHVCAASPDDLAIALTRFERRPEVLCLNPQDLGDVCRDILWVGEETCRGPQAETLLKQIGARFAALERQLQPETDRPRVVFLEWLQPFYVSGHWVPEMIHRAGGEDVFGRARTPSFRIALEDVIEAAAELGVAIVDEEAERLPAVIERHQRVARLLGDPGARWVRGAGDEFDPAALERDEEEHVDPFQPGGLDGEEITGKRRRRVLAEEVSP